MSENIKTILHFKNVGFKKHIENNSVSSKWQKRIPVSQNENALPSLEGNGIVLMIFSIWFKVDDPGNKGFPPSISPRIHPRDHMSTPFVYLGANQKQLTLLNVLSIIVFVLSRFNLFLPKLGIIFYINFSISMKMCMFLWSYKNSESLLMLCTCEMLAGFREPCTSE